MRVSKERLSVIGRLIGIYREERRDNTQNEYTQKRFCDGICSPNTLKSIEAGGLSRSEDIYIELLDKLGLKYGEFPAIDEAIDELMVELYEAIEFYDENSIQDLSQKALRILRQVTDYVYYHDLYEIINSLCKYYLEDELISFEKAGRYRQMLGFDGNYDDILKILIFARMKTESILNLKNYELLVNSLDIYNSKLNCLKINLLHYYYVMGMYLEMNKLINELEIYFEKYDNVIRLIDTYNFAIVLLSCVDQRRQDYYIQKAIALIDKVKLPNLKIGEVYDNIASSYHNRKMYDEALFYYEKTIIYHKHDLLRKLIIIADCQNHIGKEISIPHLSDDETLNYPTSMKIMYKYFTLDKDVPDFIKQNYIMKRIVPILSDSVCIEIFNYELNRLVRKTNHYKDLLVFNTKIEENKVKNRI